MPSVRDPHACGGSGGIPEPTVKVWMGGKDTLRFLNFSEGNVYFLMLKSPVLFVNTGFFLCSARRAARDVRLTLFLCTGGILKKGGFPSRE